MKHWTWKRQIMLLCGLLLVLPVAQAKKNQDEDGERQKSEQRASPAPKQTQKQPQNQIRGGYSKKDGNNRNRDEQRGQRDDGRRYEQQPRYDNNYDRRSYDRGYDQAPRYEPAPRYAPRGMNLSEAVTEAERRTGGRVLSAEPIDEGGQLFYRVKVLTPNGRVQVLFLDAQ